MIAIQIKDIKTFMSKLLNSELFDSFLLEEAQVRTYNNFLIEGHMNKDFFTKEEQEDSEIFPYEYSLWKTLKPFIFQLIKGKKVPSFLKLTLLCNPQKAQNLLLESENEELLKVLKYFVATIKYDIHGLWITTGTSFTTFVIDKSADNLWDHYLCNFLTQNGIDYNL